MLESKSMVVAPSNEQSVIKDFELFGWTLASTQEVRDTDTTIESDYYDIYTVTRTTNYVKLLFQRDKNMANYDEICRLEKIYFSEMKVVRNNYVSFFPGKLITIAVIGCIIAGIGNMWGEKDYSDGFLLIGIGIAIFILRTVLVYLPKSKRSKSAFHEAFQAKEAAKKLL